MTTFHVHLELETAMPVHDPAYLELAERLEGWDASVGAGTWAGTDGVAVSVAVDADDWQAAQAQTLDAVTAAVTASGIQATETIEMRVLRWVEFEAETMAPNYPDLVGAVEAAELLEVSRQRVHQLLRQHPDFPAPLYQLRGTGPLWTRAGIQAFARRWERKPGRPARAAAARVRA